MLRTVGGPTRDLRRTREVRSGIQLVDIRQEIRDFLVARAGTPDLTVAQAGYPDRWQIPNKGSLT